MEKICKKCKKLKPLSDFYINKLMNDGHLNTCNLCHNELGRKNYRSNFLHYQRYDKERNKALPRKNQKLIYQRKRRLLQKGKANVALNNAIRDRRVIRQPCEVCGSEQVQGHHFDYNKPLDVKWLCFRHHRELHGQTIL